MVQDDFKTWLRVKKPDSERHYSSGFNTINRICSSESLESLGNWNLDNWSENYAELVKIEEYKKLNTSGNGILSSSLNNFKLFLESLEEIVIPPKIPFDDFKWRWASTTPSEGINRRSVLFGVLQVLVKHNGKRHDTQDFRNDLIILEDSIDDSQIRLSKKDRPLKKNIIENSGQYWKALNLINSTTDGTISVTDLGLSIVNDKLSNIDFIRYQIENFILPNEMVERPTIIEQYRSAKVKVKPIQLIIKVLSVILQSAPPSECYITVDEVAKIFAPLSVDASIDARIFAEHIFAYREDSSKYLTWPNYTPEVNDLRMISEYLIFLNNFGALSEVCTDKKSKRYYINTMTLDLIKECGYEMAAPDTLDPHANHKGSNKIYFGAPGTGKSHTVNEITQGQNVKQVTFHPEYDHSSFVGAYKPTMNGSDIEYSFVSQIFTDIYVEAWQNLGWQYYLQIEEINRGNCAEIFGDLFQLLDRDDEGFSKYSVDANKDLKEYLEKHLGESPGIQNGKICLPSNLTIIATMNTSDQSLFPMDSAFKRRWDWKYVPIEYNLNFQIKLSKDESFSWSSFIEEVNRAIKDIPNLGMDKCLGGYFIKPDSNNEYIELEDFISKVIFYLWNDVFKDESEDQNIFPENVTYEDFFPIESNGLNKVEEILEKMNVEITDESSI